MSERTVYTQEFKEMFNVEWENVCNVLRRNPITTVTEEKRKKVYTKKDERSIVSMILEGSHHKDIGENLGRTANAINRKVAVMKQCGDFERIKEEIMRSYEN